MNYQIKTVVNVLGGVRSGMVGIPAACPLQGAPIGMGAMPVDGDIIISCRNLSSGDATSIFYYKITAGSIIQTRDEDFSANTYQLVIATPIE